MSFMTAWQSLQTRRFFITRSVVPGGVVISPNATASFSLCLARTRSFSPSSMSSSTTDVSGTYPRRRASSSNPSSVSHIAVASGCAQSPAVNSCTVPSTDTVHVTNVGARGKHGNDGHIVRRHPGVLHVSEHAQGFGGPPGLREPGYKRRPGADVGLRHFVEQVERFVDVSTHGEGGEEDVVGRGVPGRHCVEEEAGELEVVVVLPGTRGVHVEEGVGEQSGGGEERELGGGPVDGAASAEVPQARARAGGGRGGGRRRGAGGEPRLGERRVQLRERVGGVGARARWRRRPGARREH
nr:unnamed protein product [Digitaria exilis]